MTCGPSLDPPKICSVRIAASYYQLSLKSQLILLSDSVRELIQAGLSICVIASQHICIGFLGLRRLLSVAYQTPLTIINLRECRLWISHMLAHLLLNKQWCCTLVGLPHASRHQRASPLARDGSALSGNCET